MTGLAIYTRAAERIANDSKVPASVADWACLVYDTLTDNKGLIAVRDLLLLEAYMESESHGIYLISRKLMENS